jgi:hypothetical protein
MENPFNNVMDNWSKDMALHTMDGKNKKLDLAKSQSELDIRNTKNAEIMASVPNEMTKSGIIESSNVEVDNMKRYTINGPIAEVSGSNSRSMKKPGSTYRYTPPVLTYQQSLAAKEMASGEKLSEQKLVHERSASLLEAVGESKQQSASNTEKVESKLMNSASNQSLHSTMVTSPNRIMSKHKT